MTEKELWQAYTLEKPACKNEEYEAWCYGSDDPDLLVELTLNGIKTATASAYPFYEYEECDLPKVGDYNIILKTDGSALCIIRTTSVKVVPFLNVSAEHAYLEGEGDRSLCFWREVHASCFAKELIEIDQTFSEDMLVVCEEFEVVYRAE